MSVSQLRRSWVIGSITALALVMSGCSSNSGTKESTSTTSQAKPADNTVTVTNAADSVKGQPQGPFTRKADGKLTIGWVELTADCQSCVKALAKFNQFIKDNNYPWKVETLNSQGDASAAARAIEDFTTRKVDAIVTGFVVLKAAGAAIDGANKANIPVFSLDSGWTPGTVGDITTNNFAMGAEIASYMSDSLGGKGNVVTIWSDQHYGVVIRHEMLEAMTKSRYPGINILGSKNVTLGGYFQESTAAAEDFVSRFGKKIDAVYCGFDEPCEAASKVFKKAGLNVPMFGFDGHEQALSEIRANGGTSGLVATMAQQFGPFATTVGTWIQQILVEGKPVKDVIPVPEVYLTSKLITARNAPAKDVDGWTATDFYDVISGAAATQK